MHDVLEGNQINRLMDDLHRTSLAVEQFGLLAKQSPGEREAAIGQLARKWRANARRASCTRARSSAASAKRRCDK